MDYLEQELIRKKVENLLEKKENLLNYLKKYIQYESITGGKHGGQYLHSKHIKVRAKISKEDLITLIEKDLKLPLTTNQKLYLTSQRNILSSVSEKERVQYQNKILATQQLLEKVIKIIDQLYPPVRILESKEPLEAKNQRIKEKKIRSQIKKLRKKLK